MERSMSQRPNRPQKKGSRNPNRQKSLSFRNAFESEQYRHLLERIRTKMPCSTVTVPSTSCANDLSLSGYLVEGGDMNEELLVARFRSYLLAARDNPNEEGASLTGRILEEYLNAIGPQAPSFWG